MKKRTRNSTSADSEPLLTDGLFDFVTKANLAAQVMNKNSQSKDISPQKHYRSASGAEEPQTKRLRVEIEPSIFCITGDPNQDAKKSAWESLSWRDLDFEDLEEGRKSTEVAQVDYGLTDNTANTSTTTDDSVPADTPEILRGRLAAPKLLFTAPEIKQMARWMKLHRTNKSSGHKQEFVEVCIEIELSSLRTYHLSERIGSTSHTITELSIPEAIANHACHIAS